MSAPGEALGSIFWRFLRFGALAWGGPAAQIAMIKHECVDELGWIGEDEFRRTLAVYQVLPGPEAHELCVFFGRLRGGRLGGFLAGLGFMLPGFILMLAASILYIEADVAEHLDEAFYGLKAAVGALIARAVVRLGGSFITGLPLALIAAAAFALTAFASVSFFIVLGGAGIAYELWRRGGYNGSDGADGPRRPSGGSIGAFFPTPAIALGLAGAVGLGLTAEIFFQGLLAGLVTFGGAFTVIPFLQDAAVEAQGWLTQSQFLDGLAIGGILPAPLIIFSTFVGYLAGGLDGSLVMTLGIFLPAFVLPIFFHRGLVALAENPHARPFLSGVAAGVIGLIAAVGVEIVDEGVVDVWTAALAILAFAALQRWHGKLTVLYVVLGCGVAGVGLQLTVV